MHALPILLIPGLAVTARLYAHQIPALWRFGPVMVANHTHHDSMSALAGDILAHAPPRFALAGLSMGGYIAFEIVRQAPERVLQLALLDTSARPDTPEQTGRRRETMGLAEASGMRAIAEMMFPAFVHARRRDDAELKALVEEMFVQTGPEAFIRQQSANIGRPDSRPGLPAIRCPTLVLAGDGDELTPPALAGEIVQGIEGARLVTVPDCGHLSTLEQPEFVTRALVEWLQES